MFDIYKTHINGWTRKLCADIELALRQKTPAETIEQLLTVRDAAEATMSRPMRCFIEKQAFDADSQVRAMPGILAVSGILVAMGGVLVAMAGFAFGGLIAVASLLSAAVGCAIIDRAVPNLCADCQTVACKIDAEVNRIAFAQPEEAVRSPRFLKRLLATHFSAAARTARPSDDAAYQKLAARVSFPPQPDLKPPAIRIS